MPLFSQPTIDDGIRQPPRLVPVQSPVVVGVQHTDIIGDPSEALESFARHRAVALSGLLDPAFLQTLLRLCNKATFVRDTETDVAQREREVPGIAGSALTLAHRHTELGSALIFEVSDRSNTAYGRSQPAARCEPIPAGSWTASGGPDVRLAAMVSRNSRR